MATKGKPSIGRLKDKIKKNERRIKELEDKLKEHDEECQPKINDLHEEIRRLQEENDGLREEIRGLKTDVGDLKQSNNFLEAELGDLKQSKNFLERKVGDLNTQLKKYDKKFKERELSDDELVIRQLCSKVQQNILKIVLQKYFKEKQHKSIADMKDYIELIEDENDQQETISRWKEYKKNINWKNGRITVLSSVKERGNDTAHPKLTEEKIDAAKSRMKDDLTEDMVKAVDYLKNTWKETSRMLSNGTSSRKGQYQGRSRIRSASSGRSGGDTYASIANKGAQGQWHTNGLVINASKRKY